MPQPVARAHLEEAKLARTRAALLYLTDPNVSLVDVGWRIKEREGRRVERQLTVRVHVHHKLRGHALESLAQARPGAVVSEEAIGFPCDVIESSYRLHPAVLPVPASSTGWAPSTGWAAISPISFSTVSARDRVRPVRGGISLIREGGTAATLGAIVLDRRSGAPMVLSNWHVLAGWAFAPRGQRILQPSPFDGGVFNDTIAYLDRDAMAVGLDAATATLLPTVPYINDQFGIGPLTGLAAPELDMRVIKSGRTTGVTEGIIDGLEGEVWMSYAGFGRSIRHIVHIAPFNTSNVSAGGDSGCLHLERSTRRAVGLHFAGSDAPDYALAMAMPQVLDALQVNLALA